MDAGAVSEQQLYDRELSFLDCHMQWGKVFIILCPHIRTMVQ
jgi:hypothetical protein